MGKRKRGIYAGINRKKMVVQRRRCGHACKAAAGANVSFFGKEEQRRERAFRRKVEMSDSKLATTQ